LYANHQEYHLQVYAVFEQMLADPIFPKHDFMMHMLETTRETQLKLCCWSSLWEELYMIIVPRIGRVAERVLARFGLFSQ
jgi:hypothetical protein